jgi:16S rRNA (cytidine1402-2'-O)-methyltransferase
MMFESGLYVVATPIGNLADMSQRAIDLLEAAEIVAVEDSRVTGKLLHHLGLKKKMRRYNDHSGEAERESLVAAARGAVARRGVPQVVLPGAPVARRDGRRGPLFRGGGRRAVQPKVPRG